MSGESLVTNSHVIPLSEMAALPESVLSSLLKRLISKDDDAVPVAAFQSSL